MNLVLFISYLLTVSAIIATPGPSTMLMVSHSINYGKGAVFLNAIGSAFAAIILIIIAIFLVDKTLPPEAVPILSIIGSLYLIYIGYSSLRNKDFDTEVISKKTDNFFLQSFVTGISNPKDILFFIVFLPQFIDYAIDFKYAVVLLVIGWVFCDLFIMVCYGLLAANAGGTLSNNFISKTTKLMGFIIIFIGSTIGISSIYKIFFE